MESIPVLIHSSIYRSIILLFIHLSRAHRPMIVVGTNDPGQVASTRLQIFEFSEDSRYNDSYVPSINN